MVEEGVGDSISDRVRVLARIYGREEREEEERMVHEPIPEESLQMARHALEERPGEARAAQGKGMDRNNIVKIL